MIPEHDPCLLTEALPELNLPAGYRGVVVGVFQGGKGYAVEFFDGEGNTIDITLLDAKQIRPVTESQPATARG